MNRGRRNDGRRTSSRNSSAAASRADGSQAAPEVARSASRTSGSRTQDRPPQGPQPVGQDTQSSSAGPDPYQMHAMSHALPNYGQQTSQAFAANALPTASRPMMMPPPAGMLYQLPQGYGYAPNHPYGSPPVYPGYGQPSFVHGFPMQANSAHPSYAMYLSAQHARDPMAQVNHFSQSPSQYHTFYDSLGDHMRQMNMPPSSSTNARRNETFDYAQIHAQQPGHGMLDHGSRARHSIEYRTADAIFGPPRKPRQSGYAIWVGNLPPTATILPLKDHFSQGFSREIESVFLISKSNCAFVNYRTEEACNRAIQRFHDSRFDGVRLVCRLRKASVTGPTTPAVLALTDSANSNSSSPTKPETEPDANIPSAEIVVDGQAEDILDSLSRSPKKSGVRYFILKSLTLQDLEQSARDNVWATQVHNENVLNEAFKTSDNVFLIFSVNKSGEYFGYARMQSAIEVDGVQVRGPTKRFDAVDSNQQHRIMPALATKSAPRGRVTDDSFRGTIFWEAEYTDDEELEDATEKATATEPTWGNPFKIEWVSRTSLPFWRTKGIRNPWNANREVKIARDGTELESSVGERLIRLFHSLELQ